MNLKTAIHNLLNALKPEAEQEHERDLRTGQLFRHATYQKRGGRRHRPYTKPPLTGESKVRRKMAAKSRRINQVRSRQ